jgi:hypothetical protein
MATKNTVTVRIVSTLADDGFGGSAVVDAIRFDDAVAAVLAGGSTARIYVRHTNPGGRAPKFPLTRYRIHFVEVDGADENPFTDLPRFCTSHPLVAADIGACQLR